MSSAENRQALRVPCVLPIRVQGEHGHQYTGTIRDVSRTGLRLWIPATELDVHETSLLVLAQRVEELLGSAFGGDLHYEMLGPLVHKGLTLVRLGHSAAEAAVELGCVFDSPLTDDESVMLGLGLPQIGVTEVDAYRDVPAPRRRGDAWEVDAPVLKPKAFDAYVHPSEGHEAEPLAGATYGMKADGATVEIEITPELEAPDLPSLTVSLAQAYGPMPTLEILDGLRMLWNGSVDIRRVEAADAGRLLLHMAAP